MDDVSKRVASRASAASEDLNDKGQIEKEYRRAAQSIRDAGRTLGERNIALALKAARLAVANLEKLSKRDEAKVLSALKHHFPA